jgi:hypothetical protein
MYMHIPVANQYMLLEGVLTATLSHGLRTSVIIHDSVRLRTSPLHVSARHSERLHPCRRHRQQSRDVLDNWRGSATSIGKRDFSDLGRDELECFTIYRERLRCQPASVVCKFLNFNPNRIGRTSPCNNTLSLTGCGEGSSSLPDVGT